MFSQAGQKVISLPHNVRGKQCVNKGPPPSPPPPPTSVRWSAGTEKEIIFGQIGILISARLSALSLSLSSSEPWD